MKVLVQTIIMLGAFSLIACGKGGGGDSTGSNPTNPGNPVTPSVPTHIYSMQVTGDGTTFSLAMSANWGAGDEVNVSTGSVTIGAGETKTYNVTGRYLRQTQINRQSTPGSTLTAKLYRDGVLVETSPGLNSAGTWHLFSDRD